jgi:UDPglucose--hexose-1-phosphate uridylyltransferase
MPEVHETENRKVGQWRRFLGTGKWVIIPVPGRQKKPAAFLVREKQDFDEKKERGKNCPFCVNKLNKGLVRKKNPEELKGALVEDDTGGTKWLGENNPELLERVKNKKWKTCIIKNINPVLDQITDKTVFVPRQDLPYISAEGLGICDLIIESQAHFKPLGVLDKEVCKNVISTYLYRFDDLQDRVRYPGIESISIFHNHRREAGATIPHSHSQLFATPFVPTHIESEIEQARNYFRLVSPDDCPFCDMIDIEQNRKRRLIRENASFIAIAPFTSGSPFEIWILPKKHNHLFEGISKGEICDLAQAHRYWHWHIRIETQGLVIPAGYEMASQVRINPLPPEKAAKFLRNNGLGALFKPGAGSIFKRKPEDIENVLSIIRREVNENTLDLSVEQEDILKTAAKTFMFSEYYIKRKDRYKELMEEEKRILDRAISWASS